MESGKVAQASVDRFVVSGALEEEPGRLVVRRLRTS